MNQIKSLTKRLKDYARNEGIELVGIASIKPFIREGKETKIINPEEIFPGAQSIVVVGMCFYHKLDATPSEQGIPRGYFTQGSRVYTTARRYCEKTIKKFLKNEGYKSLSSLKIPAKMAAVRAGLGKYGKNCVVHTKIFGSWVMFECLITDAPLDYEDHELRVTECDTCDLCIKQCPTQAILKECQLDRDRCITNWLWGKSIPPHLREFQKNRLFGCGECLMSCPKNERIQSQLDYQVILENYTDSVDLIPLLTGDREYFKKVVPSFPRWAGMDVIKANAIIALGNIEDPVAIDSLHITLQNPKPKIRSYSAWALGKIGGEKARRILEEALKKESNKKVYKEIEDALV